MFSKLHWENNGKWSAYEFFDKIRVRHVVSPKVAYFEIDMPENTSDENIKALCEAFVEPWMYVREREVCACIRCGQRNSSVMGRESLNNADMCERCFNATEQFKDGSSAAAVYYEILPFGIKGKEIKSL